MHCPHSMMHSDQDREYARPEQMARLQFSTSVLVWRWKRKGKAQDCKMRHECGERDREQRYHEAESCMNREINQESRWLCEKLSDDFRHVDSPNEGNRTESLSVVSTLCTGPWN